MDTQRLKALKLARPFRPFYLMLTDGRRLLVDAPHHMGIAPDGSRLGVTSDTGPVVLLNPGEVRDVDVLPPPLRAAE